MSSKYQRPRCFLDISINGAPQGRIVCELYEDVVPETCSNFIQLCEGSDRLGKETGKRLTYRGCSFHRIIKDFMIQGGDFSENNGTGGESVYGGTFDDENFNIRHDKPYILSMANRGPNTNGSQFFILTQPAPELDGKHVAFGAVVHGKSVVHAIENVKVKSNNSPVADVIISDCGRLVPKRQKENEERQRSTSPVEKKKAKKVEEPIKEEKQVSSIRPEDLPEEPPTRNFLLRRVPEDDKANFPSQSSTSSRYRERDRRHRSRSPQRDDRRDRYDSHRRYSSHSSSRSDVKVKGRGVPRYRSRSRSTSPFYWRREEERLIPMKKAKDLIAKKQKEAERRPVEKKEEEKEEKGRSSSREGSPRRRDDIRRPRESTPEGSDED